MGADGHTASLFPDPTGILPDLRQDSRLAAPALAPVPPRERVTLTLRTLNEARELLFLVAGADKAPALAEVVQATPARTSSPLPAALVRPTRGRVRWLVDRAAGALLSANRRS
jgi:6-phosphogluconolactonase